MQKLRNNNNELHLQNQQISNVVVYNYKFHCFENKFLHRQNFFKQRKFREFQLSYETIQKIVRFIKFEKLCCNRYKSRFNFYKRY